MPSSPSSTALSTLDVENGRRRESEETLLRAAEEYDVSPGLTDKDFRDRPTGWFDWLTSAADSTQQHRFGLLPRLRYHLAKITLFLLPSFISSYFSTAPPAKERLAPTAWLDGLRGLACVIVVIHHYFYEYANELENPYDGVNHARLIQLPIIKLVHHGPPMVKIFFIISGFVLTVKAVKITRVTGTIDGLGLISNLCSSIWKRFLRLYIPCGAGFILCAVLISLGMMNAIPAGTHPAWIHGPLERRPPTKDNIFQQLEFAFWDFKVFAWDLTLFNIRDKKYATDGHLWTIPIEFKCSMQLFLFVAGVCMLKRWLRVYVILPACYSLLLYTGSWGLSLFLFGYFLAELHSDLLEARSALPTTTPKESRFSILKKTLHITMAFAGLWLISYPRKFPSAEYTTGFQFLIPITPSGYPLPHGKRADLSHEFWQTVGAIILVWALMYLPRIQKHILNNSVVQYFGKISFALYIMHAHTQHSVGYWAVVNGLKMVGIWHYDDKAKNWAVAPGGSVLYGAVVLAGFIFVDFPLTVCWADIFWRAVDLQSVRFLRWLEPKLKR